MPCPYHSAVQHMSVLAERFDLEFPLPLFPTERGETPSKHCMIETIRAAAQKVGIGVHDEYGQPKFGGHSLRTGGAHYLAQHGVELLKIELLGRWRSPLVTHYAGLAPLADLAADLNRRKLGHHLREVVEQVSSNMSLLQTRMASWEDKAQLWLDRERLSRQEFQAELLSKLMPKLVLNTGSGVLHKTESRRDDHPQDWKTVCGWRYGTTGHQWMSSSEDASSFAKCERCFPPSSTLSDTSSTSDEL
eukprot:6490973-Amphidinium_carterae.1